MEQQELLVTVDKKVNQRKAKKLRKVARLYMQEQFRNVVYKMNYWSRLKLAWKIIRKDFKNG
jgi:Holliday junction resolvase-like predicted endonuclease